MRKYFILISIICLLIIPAASAKNIVKTPKIFAETTQPLVANDSPSTFYGDVFVEMWLGPVPAGTLLWGNTYFQETGEDYSYGSGQVMSSDENGWVHFIFPESFLDREGEEGTFTLWVSTTYLGDPILLQNGSQASTVVPIP